jgi:lipoyl(octanoyl) transferase
MTDCASAPQGPIRWRLQVDGPLSGHDNMAVDENLLDAQKDPAALPVLRFFHWNIPTLTYGRLQSGHDAANRAMIEGLSRAVRRPTGGGMVIHRDDLSLSLVWRRDHPALPSCLKNVYRSIHDTARTALAGLGVEATFHHREGPPPKPGMCFNEPAEDDLLWRGKKILGGAIRVTGWGRLYQGNLLWQGLGMNAETMKKTLIESFTRDFFKSYPS